MGVFDLFKPNLEKMAAEKDVDGLIRLLDHEDPEIQLLAAKSLLKMGSFAQPKVIEALWDDNAMIRRGAAAILGKQGGIPAKAIIGIMYAGEEDLGKPASTILRDLGEPAVTSLIQALEDDEPGVREGAIHALILIGEPAQTRLVPALVHHSFRIRSGIAEILTGMKWKAPDEDSKIRLLIAKGDWSELVRLKKPVVPHLINLLEDPYYGIRKEAASALGKTMDLRGVPPLIKSLEDPDPNVQIAAVEALATIGDRKSVPSLALALGAPSYAVRMAAANALGHFGWSPQNPKETILYAIAKEQWQDLGKMGNAAIPSLIQALGDEYYGVRTGAANVLYEMGPRAKGALLEAMKSQNPEIRRGAAEILKRKGDSARKATPVPKLPEMSTEEMIAKGTMKTRGASGQSVSGNASPVGTSDRAFNSKPGFPGPGSSGSPVGQGPSLRPQEFQEHIPTPQQNVPREFEAPDTKHIPEPGEGGQIFQKREKSGDPAAAEALHAEEILRLIASLKDEDESVRMIAAEALGKMGAPAVLPLIGVLSDPFYQVRIAVADILGDLRDSRAEKPLYATLKDEDEEVRIAAARALGKIGGQESIIPLLQACKDEYPRVCEAAVDSISHLGNSVIPILIKVLVHESPRVRCGASSALGKMHAGDAAEPLITLFKDPEISVRSSAEKALVEIGTPAFKPLTFAAHSPDRALRLGAINALSGFGERGMAYVLEALNDSDPEIRSCAAGLAGRTVPEPKSDTVPAGAGGEAQKPVEPTREIPLPDADLPKINLISEPNPLIRMLDNPNKEVQINAAQALVAMGERAIPALIESFADENRDIRSGAAETLVQMGQPAVYLLIAALQDTRPEVRAGAARTLGRMGDTQAISPLIQSMSDTSSSVRIASAEALGYLGDPIAVEPLLRALKDADGNLQRAALRALGYIGDERAVTSLIDEMGNEDYSVRTVAIEALVEIGEPSVPSLIEALIHPVRDIRTGAAECLKQIGWTPPSDDVKIPFLIAQEEWSEIALLGEAAQPALEHLLSDADVDVRMGAVTALTRLKGTGSSVVNPLVRALSDENAMVRRKALGALIEIGEPAVESLHEAENSAASPAAAQAIHQAIDRIHKRQVA
ncbi:MAG: HEAT repeat domain-containing protein [Methanoregulaceae archaeon]